MKAAHAKLDAHRQARIASTFAGAGLVWAAYVYTSNPLGIRGFVATPGLVEWLCVSILIWLIAKLRSALAARP